MTGPPTACAYRRRTQPNVLLDRDTDTRAAYKVVEDVGILVLGDSLSVFGTGGTVQTQCRRRRDGFQVTSCANHHCALPMLPRAHTSRHQDRPLLRAYRRLLSVLIAGYRKQTHGSSSRHGRRQESEPVPMP